MVETQAGLRLRADRYKSVYAELAKVVVGSSDPSAAHVTTVADATQALELVVSALKEMDTRNPQSVISGKFKALWLLIPLELGGMLPKLVEHRFEAHHTKNGKIMLIRMLKDLEKPNNLPKYNTHLVGAGGIVINPKNNDILLVKEKSIFGKYIWKIPGGQVDPGEFINQGMQREVLEETGIRATFLGMGAFRELLNFRFGASDIYYVGILRAESVEIQTQLTEVADCKWFTIREYIDSTKNRGSMAVMILDLLGFLDRELNINKRKLEDVVTDADLRQSGSISDTSFGKSPFFVTKYLEFEIGSNRIRNAIHLSPKVSASASEKI